MNSVPEIELTQAELDALCSSPTQVQDNEISLLLGDQAPAAQGATPEEGQLARPVAPERETDDLGGEHFAWLDARHLFREFGPIVMRYPSLSERVDPQFGRVIVLVYLEDKVKGVRRNFTVDGKLFFESEALREMNLDTEAFKCRIVVKIIPYRVGLEIRCWENRGRDVPGTKLRIKTEAVGLRITKRS